MTLSGTHIPGAPDLRETYLEPTVRLPERGGLNLPGTGPVSEQRRKEKETSARKERNAGTKHQNANNNSYGCGKTPPPLVKPNPSLSDSDRLGFVLDKSWTGFARPGRAQRVGGAPRPRYPAKLTSYF